MRRWVQLSPRYSYKNWQIDERQIWQAGKSVEVDPLQTSQASTVDVITSTSPDFEEML